jgi:hypothetical protein
VDGWKLAIGWRNVYVGPSERDSELQATTRIRH